MADEFGNDSSEPEKYSLAWYERWVASDLSWYDQTILDEQEEARALEAAQNRRRVLTESSVEVRTPCLLDKARHRQSKKPKKVHTERHITITELYSPAPRPRRPPTRPPVARTSDFNRDSRRAEICADGSQSTRHPERQSSYKKDRPSYEENKGGVVSSVSYSTAARSPYVPTRSAKDNEGISFDCEAKNVIEERHSPIHSFSCSNYPQLIEFDNPDVVELPPDDYMMGKTSQNIDFCKLVDDCVAEQETASAIKATIQSNKPKQKVPDIVEPPPGFHRDSRDDANNSMLAGGTVDSRLSTYHIATPDSAVVDIRNAPRTLNESEFANEQSAALEIYETTVRVIEPPPGFNVSSRAVSVIPVTVASIPDVYIVTIDEKVTLEKKDVSIVESGEISTFAAAIPAQKFSSSSPVDVKPIELTDNYFAPEKESKDDVSLDVSIPEIFDPQTTSSKKKIHKHHHRRLRQTSIVESGKIITSEAVVPTQKFSSSSPVDAEPIASTSDYLTPDKQTKSEDNSDVSTPQILEAQTTSSGEKIHKHHHRRSTQTSTIESSEIITPEAVVPTQKFSSSSPVDAEPIASTSDYLTPDKQTKSEDNSDVSTPQILEAQTTSSGEKIHKHHHRRSTQTSTIESSEIITPEAVVPTQKCSLSSPVDAEPIASTCDYLTPDKQTKAEVNLDVSTPQILKAQTTLSGKKIHKHHHRRSKQTSAIESGKIITPEALIPTKKCSFSSPVHAKSIETKADCLIPEKESKDQVDLNVSTPQIPEVQTSSSGKKIHKHRHRRSKQTLTIESDQIIIHAAAISEQMLSTSTPIEVKSMKLTDNYFTPEKNQVSLDVSSTQIVQAQTTSSEKKIHRHHHHQSTKETLIVESSKIITHAASITTKQFSLSSPINVKPIESTASYLIPEKESKDQVSLNVVIPAILETPTTSSEKQIHRHRHRHRHRRSMESSIVKLDKISTFAAAIPVQNISSCSPVDVKPIESTTDYLISEKQSKDQADLNVFTSQISEVQTTSSEKKTHRHHHRKSKHILSSESSVKIITSVASKEHSKSQVSFDVLALQTFEEQLKDQIDINVSTPQMPEVQTTSSEKKVHKHHHRRSKHTSISESSKIIVPESTILSQELSLSSLVTDNPIESTADYFKAEKSKSAPKTPRSHTPHHVKKQRHQQRRLRRTLLQELDDVKTIVTQQVTVKSTNVAAANPALDKQSKDHANFGVFEYKMPKEHITQPIREQQHHIPRSGEILKLEVCKNDESVKGDSALLSTQESSVVLEVMETTVADFNLEAPLADVSKLKFLKTQKLQVKEQPLSSISKLIEKIDSQSCDINKESENTLTVDNPETKETKYPLVDDLQLDDQSNLNISSSTTPNVQTPQKEKKKRQNRKPKAVVSEESVNEDDLTQIPSVSSPNKTPQCKISSKKLEASKTTDITLDKAEAEKKMSPEIKDPNVQLAKKRSRKSKKKQYATKSNMPIPGTHTEITHDEGLEKPETVKLVEEKQSTMALKSPLKSTKKAHQDAESSEMSNVDTETRTNNIVNQMVNITKMIAQTHEKMNEMLQKPNRRNQTNALKRLTDLEKQIEYYKLEIQELKKQLYLCKQISEKPAVDIEPTPLKASPEKCTPSSIPETVQTVVAKEDVPKSFTLPIKLPVQPASCILDTRRNLLKHFDETFKPIGDGNITSDFLKSWIFLKSSSYKDIPLLDVRAAMNLVAQYRYDRTSVCTESVNPTYTEMFKAKVPLILKLVVPYGSTHLDIVLERDRKEYLIHFHSINYCVFYEFAPHSIHKFEVDPTPNIVDRIPGQYVYRFIILNRITRGMFLVATKGLQIVLMKVLYSASFVVDETFSNSEGPEYIQFWYKSVFEDIREDDDD